jgi:hypothetical protein
MAMEAASLRPRFLKGELKKISRPSDIPTQLRRPDHSSA